MSLIREGKACACKARLNWHFGRTGCESEKVKKVSFRCHSWDFSALSVKTEMIWNWKCAMVWVTKLWTLSGTCRVWTNPVTGFSVRWKRWDGRGIGRRGGRGFGFTTWTRRRRRSTLLGPIVINVLWHRKTQQRSYPLYESRLSCNTSAFET